MGVFPVLFDLLVPESWKDANLIEYKAAVTQLLAKAAVSYSKQIRQLEGEKMGLEGTNDDISEPFCNLRKAAASSQQSFQRIALELNDHFLVPSSAEYHEGRDVGSVQDERKERYIPLSSPPSMNAHGVLGQFLFDVCVPKNVDNWDVKLSPSTSRIIRWTNQGLQTLLESAVRCTLTGYNL
ncbi:uncharacterized protein [Coffea arabica]|uniref:Uncharacterized protein n=1 Tax=Coffea arabica TaxID=13443 RepID=A0ABM4VX97_COFAR